jgi:uncharacterized protein YjiS (DUF1127 family)
VVLGGIRGDFGAVTRELGMETDMRSANFPVLPIAGGVLVRAFVALLAMVTRGVKKLLRARRNWNEASTLANLDRRMLADMGITRADLQDAFSEPFWEDPTALLRERALERRLNHAVRRAEFNRSFRRSSNDLRQAS